MLAFILTVSDGNERSFLEELYNPHSGRMYNSAYLILGSRQDAEDALQDTFIKIHNNISRFTCLSEDDLVLLIIIYTRNTARDILRRRNTALKHRQDDYFDSDGEQIFEDIPDEETDTLGTVVRRETISETARAIDELPEAQRDVIVLKYRYGMLEREIAHALGISETAVSSRMLRAKDGLRKKLAHLAQQYD